MDNFGIRLLEEKGILACNLEAILDGAKLFDKIHSLSKRHVPNQKGQLSLPLLYFGNSYNVGEKNYTLCARGGMIHQNHNLYTRRKELRECYCPRFIVVVFRLFDEETDIPQNKRQGKKLPKANLCFMLRNMLLDAFDSDEKKFIYRLFEQKHHDQFGCAIMVFSGSTDLPEMVSGCTVRFTPDGGLVQYLGTASQLVYEGKYGTGQDGHPFVRRGFGKYLLCVCQLLSMKKHQYHTCTCNSLVVVDICGIVSTAH